MKQEENLAGNVNVSSIDSFATVNRGAVANFDYVNIQGSLYSEPAVNPGNVKQTSFLQMDASYNLSVGFIARKPGKYIFTFTDLPRVTCLATNYGDHLVYAIV